MMAAAAARRVASRWFSDPNVRLSTAVLAVLFGAWAVWEGVGEAPAPLVGWCGLALGVWFNSICRASGKEEQAVAETAARAETKAERADVKAERADAKAEQADAKAAGADDKAVTALGAARRAQHGATPDSESDRDE